MRQQRDPTCTEAAAVEVERQRQHGWQLRSVGNFPSGIAVALSAGAPAAPPARVCFSTWLHARFWPAQLQPIWCLLLLDHSPRLRGLLSIRWPSNHKPQPRPRPQPCPSAVCVLFMSLLLYKVGCTEHREGEQTGETWRGPGWD